MESITIYFVVSLVLFVLWRLARPYLFPSALSLVPGPPVKSRITGHLEQLFAEDGWDFHEHLYDYGGVARVHGLFNEEQLFVFDPVALNHIILKGHESFEQDSMILGFAPFIWGPAFGGLAGDHHRRHRKMLNPVFSMKHMRGLVPVFYPISYEVRDLFANQIESGQDVVDVFKWFSLAALEFIGRGGLGHSFDALNPHKKNGYNEVIKTAMTTMTTLAPLFALLPYIGNVGNVGPAWFRRKMVDWTPSKTVQKLKNIVDVMDATSIEIYQRKKAALEEGEEALMSQVANGKDIMTILLKANSEANEESRLPENELLAQMNSLIFAAQDTTSNALSHILQLLALHPDAQTRLREEVNQARQAHGGEDLDYDALTSLPYMDAICRETLRLHPPAGIVWREVINDTILPVRNPIKLLDGREEVTSIPLKKGTKVIISILNANRSKEIWGEDATEWKPERWLIPLPQSVADAKLPGVFSSMMTFVGGGRACIGFKFAELEMKVLLFVLLESFAFSIPEGTGITWSNAVFKKPNVIGTDGKVRQKDALPLKISMVPGFKC